MKKPTDRQRHVAAYHEAGHAVVAIGLGAKVKSVSIAGKSVSIAGGGGITDVRYGRGEMREERAILIMLAGPYAQRRYAPRSSWRGDSHAGFRSGYDFDNVTGLIFERHGKGKLAETYWRYMEARAEELVEQNWKYIGQVAEALLQRETLTGEEMRELFWHEIKKRIAGGTKK